MQIALLTLNPDGDWFADRAGQLRDALGLPAPDSPAGIAAAVLYTILVVALLVLILRAARDRARARRAAQRRRSVPLHRSATRWSGEQWLIAVAIAVAAAVAVISGVRSFDAVSERFRSPLVPLTADGVVIACTALRLAALLRGWRLPGALVTTYLFIGGTVALNVASARDLADVIAHALAPLAYAVLVEFLAHLLRLHLGLVEPTQLQRGGVAGLAKLGWLMWVTSPIVTTRVGLHLARTGSDDPVAARALVQQLIRMSSRLQAICPSRAGLGWLPVGRAHAARVAALQTIRDGLLTAGQLAALLPTGNSADSSASRLSPAALLAVVDGAALQYTAPTTADTANRTVDGAGHDGVTSQSDPTALDLDGATRLHASTQMPHRPSRRPQRAERPRQPRQGVSPADDELLVRRTRHLDQHHRREHGKPISRDKVRAELGVSNARASALLREARKEEVA